MVRGLESALKRIKRGNTTVHVGSVRVEIETISKSLRTKPETLAALRPHIIRRSEGKYIAFDARAINVAHGLTGNGKFRYIFSCGKLVGLASHQGGGRDYRIVFLD